MRTAGVISNVRQEFQQGLGLLEDEVDKLRDEVAKLGGEITGGTTENATVEPLKTGTVIEIFTLRKSGESDRDMLGRNIFTGAYMMNFSRGVFLLRRNHCLFPLCWIQWK